MTLIDGLLGRDPSSSSVTQFEVIVYGAVSFLIVSILGLLIYITCSKRYRLNWFENNLLETDREREARKHDPSHVTCPIPYNVDAVAGSSRYLNRNNGSPLAKADDPPFWASQGIYKKPSNTGQLIDSSDGKRELNKCFRSFNVYFFCHRGSPRRQCGLVQQLHVGDRRRFGSDRPDRQTRGAEHYESGEADHGNGEGKK